MMLTPKAAPKSTMMRDGSTAQVSTGEATTMALAAVEPEELAAELLKSPDAKIAAAAKRIFSRPPASTCTKDAAGSTAASSATARGRIVDASIGEGSVPAAPSAGPNGSFQPPGGQKSLMTQVGVTAAAAAGTTESSSAAASALTAMATAATASFAPESVPAPSPRVAGKKVTSSERLQRSRERNRMHARKTRQRKKEHMQILQNRVDELKNEHLRLKQAINEKNTASILLGMFATADQKESSSGGGNGPVDPKVEVLMKRPTEDIPDASKIPELPALILPGQHNSKKSKDASSSSAAGGANGSGTDGAGGSSEAASSSAPQHQDQDAKVPDDGIDYELLGKDRSKCTPSELDHIRRERNRMHAKRTRDRKRIFMEEMEVIIKQLEGENKVLETHLASLNAEAGEAQASKQPSSTATTPSLAPTSPALQPSTPTLAPSVIESSTDKDKVRTLSSEQEEKPLETESAEPSAEAPQTAGELEKTRGITVEEIKTILSTAGAALEKNKGDYSGMLTISSVASAVSAQNSDEEHDHGHHDDDSSSDTERAESPRPAKRQRLVPNSVVSASC